MHRRGFIRAVTGGLLAATFSSLAQRRRRTWRIGILTPTGQTASSSSRTLFSGALRDELRDRGYIEAETAEFEVRSAEDDLARLPALAAELVHSQIDIIIAVSSPAILAASQATTTIPIVMAFWGSGEGLIESGIVASFARPGGNVTGVYMLADELEGKRLDLLLEALPNARRIAVLRTPPRGGQVIPAPVRRVAEVAKVELLLTGPPGPAGYQALFETMSKDRVDALLVPSFPRFARESSQIIEAAAQQRIPVIYDWGDTARAGGLMGYGPVVAELQRRVAFYVDRILKGTKPAELPVEQPTKFELVINLETAKALGITIPQSVLLRADEVIR